MTTTERLIRAAALVVALLSGHRDVPIDRIETPRLYFRPVPYQVGSPTIPQAGPATLTPSDIEAGFERFDSARVHTVEALADRAELRWVERTKEAVR